MKIRGRGSEEEEDEDPKRRRRGESEREQRERLAKARRERQRKARANLAALARGDESGDDEPATGEEPRERPEPRAAKPKEREPRSPTAEGREPKDSKPRGRERPKPKERERPKAGAEKRGSRERVPSRRRRGSSKRRTAPAARRGGRSAPAGLAAKAKALAADARRRIATTAPRAGRLVLRGVLAFFTAFFALIGLVFRLGIAAWRFARGPLRTALATLGRWTNAASRVATPVRVLAAVTALALVVLALTQFADYRSISIGNDNYAGGIQTVAPAPVAETDATGSAHSYLMIPLAVVGLGLLAAAVTGRWRLCRAVALIGLIAVLVGLLHDRPAGLDTGDRPLEYEGVAATLVGGFYAQLAAGVLIMASSLLLGRELHLASGAEPAARASRSTSRRRIRLRRRTGVQGARA